MDMSLNVKTNDLDYRCVCSCDSHSWHEITITADSFFSLVQQPDGFIDYVLLELTGTPEL
jgi:hypothetical protein